MTAYENIKYNFTASNLEGIVPAPTVTSIDPASITEDALPATIDITGTNFTASTAVYFGGTDGSQTISPTVVFNSATSITATVPSSLVVSLDPFDIILINQNAGTGNDLLNIDENPVFSTASGTLGTITDGARASYSLSSAAATDPEGVSVSHSILSGSLSIC